MSTHRSIPNMIAIGVFATLAVATTVFLYGSPVAVEQQAFAAHTNLVTPTNLPVDGWTGGPRECDIENGIHTECIFPD